MSTVHLHDLCQSSVAFTCSPVSLHHPCSSIASLVLRSAKPSLLYPQPTSLSVPNHIFASNPLTQAGFPNPALCPPAVLFLSVVQPGVVPINRPATPPHRHLHRCKLPLCFKHKHLKHFSCAATRQCMQLKTIEPISVCIPFPQGIVR